MAILSEVLLSTKAYSFETVNHKTKDKDMSTISRISDFPYYNHTKSLHFADVLLGDPVRSIFEYKYILLWNVILIYVYYFEHIVLFLPTTLVVYISQTYFMAWSRFEYKQMQTLIYPLNISMITVLHKFIVLSIDLKIISKYNYFSLLLGSKLVLFLSNLI